MVLPGYSEMLQESVVINAASILKIKLTNTKMFTNPLYENPRCRLFILKFQSLAGIPANGMCCVVLTVS